MHTFPKVGIIVLNYNGESCLSPCLRSLAVLEYPEKDIIIVDNNSTDNSFIEAKKQFPHFTFIQNEKNEGFAKGMNIGMKAAFARGAEWCWLFNYDAIATPQSLALLIFAAEENSRAGLLSPVIYAVKNNTPWFAKGEIDFLRMKASHVLPNKEESLSQLYPSEFLTGCALLVKKELVDTIGFLDEKFFLYYEDADYSLRAFSSGFLCFVVSEAKVFHSEESNARPEKMYHLVYSGLYFFKKWAPFYLRPYLVVYVTMRRVKNLFDRIMRPSKIAQEVGRAYREYYRVK